MKNLKKRIREQVGREPSGVKILSSGVHEVEITYDPDSDEQSKWLDKVESTFSRPDVMIVGTYLPNYLDEPLFPYED